MLVAFSAVGGKAQSEQPGPYDKEGHHLKQNPPASAAPETASRARSAAKPAALWLAAIVLVTACTVYRRPVLESGNSEPAVHLLGIVQFMNERPDLHYRLIAVHGIGAQPPTFADSWIAAFSEAAQLSSAVSQPAEVYDMGLTGNQKPVPDDMRPYIEAYRFTHTHGAQGPDLRGYAVDWSPLTQPYKQHLVQDESPPTYTRQRATLNSDLKFKLLDDRLLDAVMYAGAYRATMKQAVSDAMCRAIRDDGNTPVAAGPACSWATVTTEVASTRRLIFFTHSLGGRMVFDVLTELLNDPKGPAYAALKNGFQIYMFANQLSLLELTDHANPFDRTEDNAITRFTAALKGAAAVHDETVSGQLVAFSDPNDVLSYQVPRHMMIRLDTAGAAANVTLSNAVTWFGLIEDPIAAHDDYLINGRIWTAVASGAY
jgi:hypothetical protein